MDPWVISSRKSVFLQILDSFFDYIARKRDTMGARNRKKVGGSYGP